jgi:hypothetical protein
MDDSNCWIGRITRLVGLVAAFVVFTAASITALAAPGDQDPISLAVSVPPTATTIGPGATATIPIRILNPGPAPVDRHYLR